MNVLLICKLVLKLNSKWDVLDRNILKFTEVLVQQKEKARKTFENLLLLLRERSESFLHEWEDHKRSLLQASTFNDIEIVKSLDAFSQRLLVLRQEANNFQGTCTSFNIVELTDVSNLEVVKQDIERCTEDWYTIQDYNNELRTLSEQTWIYFRDDISRLQSFCQKWEPRLESLKDNQRGAIYLIDLPNIRALIPVLKFCIGDDFREDHWAELLQGKLQLPQTVRVENLKLVHFITMRDILQHSGTLLFLKDLQSR